MKIPATDTDIIDGGTADRDIEVRKKRISAAKE
jgi:hypothetical protein